MIIHFVHFVHCFLCLKQAGDGGVMSRICSGTHVNELKIIVLFCKRALCKGAYSAKETYHFKEPTNTHVNESFHICE